ncbi:hypothetical protein R5W23_002608 [Gemmata sp. JC673]|uniref:Uncharacterized protein n=1 Tax=Gemmata algarum TaxID=2975278 RepID=A0ABU5F1Q3_9BACT|nr:hypothetical protein [Gemmata algarum]MDY3561331.1 hypothetical protein [Gemmata algarum]
MWTFTGGKLIPQYNSGGVAAVKLAPPESPRRLTSRTKTATEGIYKFDGADKLVMCCRDDNKRSTEFAAGPKLGTILFVPERVRLPR